MLSSFGEGSLPNEGRALQEVSAIIQRRGDQRACLQRASSQSVVYLTIFADQRDRTRHATVVLRVDAVRAQT
jgi:hypothetical protein